MKRNKTHQWSNYPRYWGGWSLNEERTCVRCRITVKKSKARVTVVPPQGEFALGEKTISLSAWEVSSGGDPWLTWRLPACG